MTDIMRMVVDIGGTNARFALVSAGSPEPRDEKTVRCADSPAWSTQHDAIFRTGAIPSCGRPRSTSPSTPSAISSSWTNGPWGFSIEQTRRALGLDRLQVVNDFTALALAVPTLRPDEVQSVGGGTAVTGMPIAVIGPGTGLGVSGLIPASGRFVALQGEGGHTAFSPMNEREAGVLQLVAATLRPRLHGARGQWNGTAKPLSGAVRAGRCDAASFWPGQDNRSSAGQHRCTMRGCCGNVLRHPRHRCCEPGSHAGARAGCYIGGGIVPRLGDYFARLAVSRPFRSKRKVFPAMLPPSRPT